MGLAIRGEEAFVVYGVVAMETKQEELGARGQLAGNLKKRGKTYVESYIGLTLYNFFKDEVL